MKPPEKDAFYDFELAGCSVETVAGAHVGVVRDVLSIGLSTLLSVEGEAGSGEILIPLSEEICVAIDKDGRKIVIDPPDGLLDLNEI
jgi:16S rRNA processing protein RimM